MLKYTYRFCQLASLFGRIENFIVEDRKIERESQPNWMGRLHFGLADVVSVLVSFLRIIDHFYMGKVIHIVIKNMHITISSVNWGGDVFSL